MALAETPLVMLVTSYFIDVRTILATENYHSNDTVTPMNTAICVDTTFHQTTNEDLAWESQVIRLIKVKQLQQIECKGAYANGTFTTHNGVGGLQKAK